MKQIVSVSNTIIDELLTTIEHIGVDRTIKTLQDAKLNSLLLNDLNIDFVLNNVSELTSVSKERILSGTDRSDERKMAIALSVYFVKSEFFYSYTDLRKIFNKDESSLSRYHTIVENIINDKRQKKAEFDKKIEAYHKKIKLLITEKKINYGK